VSAIGDYFRDIYDGVVSCFIGLGVTLRYLLTPGVAITVPYDGTARTLPTVRVAQRFRGDLVNIVEDGPITDSPLGAEDYVEGRKPCIGCKLCHQACPIDCFIIRTEPTETNKLRVSRFDLDVGKCIYCGLCVLACPPKSLFFSHSFDHATFDYSQQILPFGSGFYTPEELAEVERKREEAKRKKAAAVAARKKATAAKKAAQDKDQE
jgi:formate hydrogenlyase subunit 6/NADH:ubiquinone oxidoreductase subunit I